MTAAERKGRVQAGEEEHLAHVHSLKLPEPKKVKTKRGYQTIRRAMLQNERDVLSSIRRAAREGRRWNPWTMSTEWMNALDRLLAKGRVKRVRSRSRWGGIFYKEAT